MALICIEETKLQLLLFRDCERQERQIMPLSEINGVGNTKKKTVNETPEEETRNVVEIEKKYYLPNQPPCPEETRKEGSRN